jgi:NAD(P) transhydrogenase subunit alpha
VRIRVHRETRHGERRIALVPRGAQTLVDAGHAVVVPAGAGQAAGFRDGQYRDAGAEVAEGPAAEADVVLAVGPVTADDVAPAGAVISFLDPLGAPDTAVGFAAAGITAFSMELIPRTTLAQTMDALSSQATSAGYEAVLAGAAELPRFLPMMMTAAGTIRPAKVLVLGAGVAGLQAIATARRLGAVVAGYDIRPAAREQVESLGATFVGGPVEEDAETAGGYAGEVTADTRQRQLEALHSHVAAADLVITTAQVPGRAAPVLVTTEMVEAMAPGSVVVDLATSTGGNCEVSRPGETVVHAGVTVLGPLDLPSRTAGDASEMYSRNVVSLLTHLTGEDGTLTVDLEDEITAGACVTHGGEILNEWVRAALEEGA